MQSYTFNELTRRAKDLAIARYGEDQLKELANWRYTEHGERIA